MIYQLLITNRVGEKVQSKAVKSIKVFKVKSLGMNK